MNSITPPVLAAIALSIATSPSLAIIYTIDVSGMATWGLEGDPANDFLNVFIAPNADITRITWDLNITTLDISWAEEVTIGFLQNSLTIQPAAGDDFEVTNQNYQGSLFTPNLTLGADGMLDIELFETDWDDNTDANDAVFEAGSTITIHIPAPSTLAMLGIGGLATTRRRR